MIPFKAPLPLMVDAYQATHGEMIPEGMHDFQCSQVIYRKPLEPNDHRIVSAGLRIFIETVLKTPITQEDIDEATDFYSDFHAHFEEPFVRPYPWPKAMFQRVVDEFGGLLPIVVTGLRDGTAHYVGEPCVQVWTDVEGMGELVGWIESTMLPYLWTSSVVATRGRMRKEKFQQVFKECYPTAKDEEIAQMIAYRFHDFGRRGGASSLITGIAHLMNWDGTDTMDAAYAAMKYLNNGEKSGACSIIAAAHRSITPWDTEDEAYDRIIHIGKSGLVSVVADSYNYWEGLKKLCSHAEEVKEAGGVLIVRPDSGDPVECVVKGLQILDDAFGHTEQESGLKVLNNAAIIQGDGVNDEDIFEKILPAVIVSGYSPINVAFGMGESNHKALRSDLEAAYKTCAIGLEKGESTAWDYKPVMKGSNSLFKMSLPCPVSFRTERTGSPHAEELAIFEGSRGLLRGGNTGDLIPQYDGRGIMFTHEISFNEMKQVTDESWDKLVPEGQDRFEPEIRSMQRKYMVEKTGKATVV